MYPIHFEPIYQDYVWGGNRIAKKFNREIKKKRVAESWEISDRSDGMSVVSNGAYKGKTLHELLLELGEDLVGKGQKFDRFPLLLKIIDAKENLSIQVHPDEKSASSLEGEAKSEMWFILEEGSVYVGLKKGTTEKELLKGIKLKKAENFLEKLDLHKGESIYIPGGRVHAICEGTLLFEVQQNSNTTYRLYDWGRTDRELHLEKAMQAIHWHERSLAAKAAPHRIQSDLHHQLLILVSSPFFIVERIDIFDQLRIGPIPKTFQIFFCIEGGADLIVDGHKERLTPGITFLVPAACSSIEVVGRCEVLRVRLP